MKRYIGVSVLAFGVATYVLLLNHYLSRDRAASRHSAAVTSWNSIQRFQLQIVPSSQGDPDTMLKLDTLTGEVWKYSEDTAKWLPVRDEPRPKAALDVPVQHFEVDAVVEEGDKTSFERGRRPDRKQELIEGIEIRGLSPGLSAVARSRITSQIGTRLDSATLRQDFGAVWSTGLYDDLIVECVEGKQGIIIVFRAKPKAA